MTVTAQDLTRLNRDVIGEIREMHPLLTPKLTNATIKRVVKDYLTGGARKQRIVQKYGDISQWDVSNVTNIKLLFWNQSSFNQPLNKWNVSNVENMYGMFADAASLDGKSQNRND